MNHETTITYKMLALLIFVSSFGGAALWELIKWGYRRIRYHGFEEYALVYGETAECFNCDTDLYQVKIKGGDAYCPACGQIVCIEISYCGKPGVFGYEE